ncbi:LacI family DNA-binding transcriptional regulator [Streptomyces sp. NPDC093111]|uniref:LacI family DNA-binding transcriptional regulator n=1 Tax=Streptomyces sp. NPDC093111 TaxID=3154978 RepID=UPI00341F1275
MPPRDTSSERDERDGTDERDGPGRRDGTGKRDGIDEPDEPTTSRDSGAGSAKAGDEPGGKPSKPTMRDVAARAGVSSMTVSRVLRDDPRISESARGKVLSAVSALGYRLNENARALRLGQGTRLVALMVTNLANPFYSRLALGLESELERHGLLTVVANTADKEAKERALTADFVGRRVEGLIVVPAGEDHAHLRPEHTAGTPAVLVARPPVGHEADCVLVDDFGGGRSLAHRLIAEGHRRIAFLGNAEAVYTSSERLRGFLAAHDEAAVPHDPALVRQCGTDPVQALRAARDLLTAGPTAVVTANNRNTLAVLRAAQASGARVAVAGFDDVDTADLLDAPLTVAAYDAEEVGRRAARMLVERLDAPSVKRGSRTSVVPVEIRTYRGAARSEPTA